MADLFGAVKLPRAKPVKRMHVNDAGDDGTQSVIEFVCGHCGYNSGWVKDEWTVTENRRGHPCPKCNEQIADSQPAPKSV